MDRTSSQQQPSSQCCASHCLVGGIPTPPKKYESVGMMTFPTIKAMFQTTNQPCFCLPSTLPQSLGDPAANVVVLIVVSSILIWFVVSTPLKNISQIGSSSQLLGKIKNVPNHQPVMVKHLNLPAAFSKHYKVTRGPQWTCESVHKSSWTLNQPWSQKLKPSTPKAYNLGKQVIVYVYIYMDIYIYMDVGQNGRPRGPQMLV